MSTSNIMHCRHCEKYIGHKINLDEYFFWCGKECFDADEKAILERNLASMEVHDSRYKGKTKYGMTGSLDAEGNIIDKVMKDAGSQKQQQPNSSKKSPSKTKKK